MALDDYPLLQQMHSVPAYTNNGLAFVDAGEGWAEVRLQASGANHNLYGFVHGGIWLLVADSAMGGSLVTLATEGEQVITTQLDFRWLRRFTGSTAFGRGRVLHRGRTVSHCEVEIRGEDGKPIAKGTGTYVLV